MISSIKQGKILVVSLNRPEVHNAFHPDMIKSLTDTFRSIKSDGSIHLVVLRGEGKSFSAGADLNWMKSMATFSEKENYEDALRLFDMFQAIYDCPVPSICLAHGNVFGGGLGFVAACDLVIAEENTKLCFSEVKWGLSPATISPFVRTKISNSKALQWMLSADVFDEKEAKDMGLVNWIAKDVKTEAKARTKHILENGYEALCETKKLLRAQVHSPRSFREETARVIAQRRTSKEGQEGLQYFLTKTLPSWKGNEEGLIL